MLEKLKTVKARYESTGNKIFTLFSDDTFLIMRSPWKDHIASGLCDTVAKGDWSVVNGSVLRLTEIRESRKVRYKIDKENKLSADSVYFKMVLPRSDTFFNDKFNFSFAFIHQLFNAKGTMLVLHKRDAFKNDMLVSLTATDQSPMHAGMFGKCYQRVIFHTDDNIMLDKNFNYYTINLINFTGCFVERAAVDGDYVVLTKNGLHWQDIDFKKIK